ncbi:tetratricopeptide repeat protein [Verrucomicrobiaceae bacterium 5K15]|uniref:Tetratricopeptide repeat protein n=1 Tax=Oceaniferula flava TaxID=2800421 RepID=A0AAE2SCD4_9BACT|nr:tetratricopeptide repeat protein [Oceaniferula flavus]MBK1855263.1 tetratricopeptide repeat protein [Oceaniferula flavus]MBM1136569.1 tetratricopeptide repeat protein [Oceaniferula flavus]
MTFPSSFPVCRTALLSLSAVFFASCGKEQGEAVEKKESDPTGGVSKENSNNTALHQQLAQQPGQNAVSSQCMECHQDIHHHWQSSQHGQANRLLNLALDSEPFSDQKLDTPSEKWTFTLDDGQPVVTANGKSYHAGMAIGVEPLVQYLVSSEGGRWQTPNAAWDPEKKEWFDVFNGDLRTSADWGHWSGRGMTWNTQCAFCHMTDFDKNYDIATDSYDSKWKEMGIGCTQCHGDMAEKADAKTGCLIDLAKHHSIKKNHPALTMDNCASCHSRRGELDGKFKHGEKFGDHYQLQLPTQPHLYYPDGQIKDEDYVWTSLKLSNMGHKGVNCMDCHDPHTTKLKMPVANNTLCMSCHAGGSNGRIEGAIVIDPSTHTKHFGVGKHNGVGSGHSCVDCHMTHTTYMGRDPRRDHGFHVPDPQMTKELGIPNACNKCHEDQDTDWAIKWTNTWFGDKMNSPERQRQRARTRAIGAAFNGQQESIDALLAAYAKEENTAWKATLLQIMQSWATDPRVQQLGREGVHSKDSLLRASACMVLEFSTDNGPWLEPMLNDPVKEVRMAAAWAMRTRLSLRSEVRNELEHSLAFTADQPAGAMRTAQLAIDANQLEKAERWMQRAVTLDETSAAAHESYAVLLGRMGKPNEALKQLQTADQLAPGNPRYAYLMALTYSELGRKDKTEELLKKAIQINPGYDRAHYNLGLLLAGQNKLDEAIASIRMAERINPSVPDYPYARATLHMRKGDKAAAFEACRSALGADRNHQPSIQLLRQIGNPNQP